MRKTIVGVLLMTVLGVLAGCNMFSFMDQDPAGDGTDTSAPLITLVGEATVTLAVGSTYIEPGATATDDQDDDAALTEAIVIDSSDVDTSVEGTYTVTYNVSDSAGNAAPEVARTVIVTEPGDTTALEADINDARFLLQNTGVGTEIGMVTQQASNDLSDAIGAAETVSDSGVSSQADIDAAVTDLAAAVTAFEDAIIAAPPSGNIVVNGDFAIADDLNDNINDAGQWSIWSEIGTTGSNTTGAAVITVPDLGTAYWSNQFWQKGMELPAEGTYVVSFLASADVATDVNLRILPTGAAVDQGDFIFRLSDTAETYTASFDIFGMAAGSTLELRFNLGSVTTESVAATITIDDVVVETGDAVPTSSVTLQVTDGTNPVSGATITIEGADVATSQNTPYVPAETVTDGSGGYALSLADRVYRVTVSKDGYETVTETMVVEGTTSFDVTLTEEVIVPPDPPAGAGIFDESKTGITPGTDGGFGSWTNGDMTYALDESVEVAEGSAAIAVTYPSQVLGGVFAFYSDTGDEQDKTPTDISGYTSLVFAVKSSATLTDFNVKLESTGGDTEIIGVPGAYGATADTTTFAGWTVYTIPLADFTDVDLTAVTVPFSFWHPNGGSYTGTVYLDAIYLQ